MFPPDNAITLVGGNLLYFYHRNNRIVDETLLYPTNSKDFGNLIHVKKPKPVAGRPYDAGCITRNTFVDLFASGYGLQKMDPDDALDQPASSTDANDDEFSKSAQPIESDYECEMDYDDDQMEDECDMEFDK